MNPDTLPRTSTLERIIEKARHVAMARRATEASAGDLMIAICEMPESGAAEILLQLGFELPSMASVVQGALRASPASFGSMSECLRLAEAVAYSNHDVEVNSGHALEGMERAFPGYELLGNLGGDSFYGVRLQRRRMRRFIEDRERSVTYDRTTVPDAERISLSHDFVVANAERRQKAIDQLRLAIDALSGLEDGTIEADLVKTVMVPQLNMAVGALELRTSELQDLLRARAQIRTAQSLLESAVIVYERYRVDFLVGVLGNAAFALAQSLIP